MYTKSHLEDWIENLYRSISIITPEQIDFERIAELLGISVYFKPIPSCSFKYNDVYTIILDSRKTRFEQWDDFAHELCHLYRHEGDKKQCQSFGQIIRRDKPITSHITFASPLLCFME